MENIPSVGNGLPIKNTVHDELKALEFLALNSKEIIEKQVDSYRQQHTYAGTIIGFTVLYIPFFLNSLEKSKHILQLISIVPIAIFIGSILLMLRIFRGKALDQALSVVKYEALLTKSYKQILLYEIEANKSSYLKNNLITKQGNKKYMQGAGLTTIAIIISIILLLVSTFLSIEKVPTKVQVVNPKATIETTPSPDNSTLK